MPAMLRPYIGRFVSAWIAAASGWLAHTVGVEISPDDQVLIFNASMGVLLTVYGVAHKAINSKLNPVDAAKIAVAEQSNATQ